MFRPGVYLVSFVACMRVLFSGAGIQSNVNRGMLAVALLMAFIATLGLALGLRHVLEAFIWYRGPGGPTAEFEKISSWIQVTKNGCYIFQTLTGDLILIYRCFIVYNRSWLVVALPLTMWTGTLVCGCAVLYISSHLKISTNLDEKHLVPFLTALLVLTLVQNAAISSMIAYRIRSIDRQIAKFSSDNRASRLQPIMNLIIESGAIYTVSMIICLIVVLCSNNAQYAVSDAIIMIIGIVFNMIIIRVHQGRTVEQEVLTTGVASSRHTLSFANGPEGRSTFSNSHPLTSFGKKQTRGHAAQRVEVNVTRQVVKEVNDDLGTVFVEDTANTEAKH